MNSYLLRHIQAWCSRGDNKVHSFSLTFYHELQGVKGPSVWFQFSHSLDYMTLNLSGSFPGGTSVKKPACQCRRHKRHRFYPWVGKIPLEKGMATHSHYPCLENPMNRGTWQAIVHGVAKSQTQLKQLSMKPLWSCFLIYKRVYIVFSYLAPIKGKTDWFLISSWQHSMPRLPRG